MSDLGARPRRLRGVAQAPSGTGVGPAVLVTAVLAAIGVLVAGLAVGAPAAWGVVVGAVTTIVVFSLGMSVTHAAATLSPALSLLVALLTYLLQLVLLVVVLVWLERSTLLGDTLDRTWIGGTVIVGTLVWSAALVRAELRRPGHYHSGAAGGESAGEAPTRPDPGGRPPR